MEKKVSNENSARSLNSVELYTLKPVKLPETAWIDASVYKRARVTFMVDTGYYDPSSQALGSFEINIPDLIEQCISTAVDIYTHACVIGLNGSAGDKCAFFYIEVDADNNQISISADNSTPIFNTKVLLEKY